MSKSLQFLTPENMISNAIFDDVSRRGFCDYDCEKLFYI